MARPSTGKWVKDKFLVLPNKEDCYIYKRPNSNIWQYYLQIPSEGEERKSTKIKGDASDIEVGKAAALEFALNRKLEVMSRQKQGLKARRVKLLFDFIDDFLKEESNRIADYNIKGNITSETFRVKRHHLKLFKKFYGTSKSKLEDLDYPKLHQYPIWRQKTTDENLGIKPPKTNHTILTELSTIKAYFAYLERLGYISRFPTFHKITRESPRTNRRDFLNERQYKQTINSVRAWSNSASCTKSQTYNRRVLYQAILIMSNSCMRIGELRGLKWYDLIPNDNLSKEDQQIGHLINIRAEITKVGTPRVVQAPTVQRFNELRALSGIPKKPKSHFPHIPSEYMNYPVLSKFNRPELSLGTGTLNRCWKEIKELCALRYWNEKNITWYSFRHTGISFAVSRGVPMLQLSRNCGTGSRYVEDVYYHHEAESKQTWDSLNQNRQFKDYMDQRKSEVLTQIEDALDIVEDWELPK